MSEAKVATARGTDTPWYRGWNLTEAERAVFRDTTLASKAAKRRAEAGECDQPKYPVNVPRLDTRALMPRQPKLGLRALSLFSGGGGMDIGFERAGFSHAASYEILNGAAAILRKAHPEWDVFGGSAGDVTGVNWSQYRGKIDILHGGPPCQPFSHAGRRSGADDIRNMIPEFVRAVTEIEPEVFVCENVSGLKTKQFSEYIRSTVISPLSPRYNISSFYLDAADYGVPQKRKRIFFVGFADPIVASVFRAPIATHCYHHLENGSEVVSLLPKTMGAREALGLSDIGTDALAPTIRSGLTGPRHTTSVLNSVSALRVWNSIEIWPNGVSEDRTKASAYPAKNGHFRLSLADCMVLQGFPDDWPIERPVYFGLGMIGNSVAPPMAYHLAHAIGLAVLKANSEQAASVDQRDHGLLMANS